MKVGTKFGIVTGIAAGMSLASGSWIMWGAWTVLCVVGTTLLNKRDLSSLSRITQETIDHIHKVIRGGK